MEIGLVKRVDITTEMRQAYLDYAMSVIVARALPDARDGLKPVQRRILYAMHDMGLRSNSAYKKSARIVGEVLGKYHPHGDQAVYDAMARLAQDFSMRYPLVDGQGNFGSVDGDPPAAMRYTEARLSPIAETLLADIAKDTVDFAPNFDESLQEPTVLPAAFPNLLVNGATGIAVGMSTNIPPHNLGEVIDALVLMLEKWNRLDNLSVDDLMKHIPGPDFPTGGLIVQAEGEDGLRSAYSTGRGKITVQALMHTEGIGRGRQALVVTELPYAVNKSSLLERIASLTRDGKLEGITDLRDESDRQGMRIVIELGKNADPDAVLASLYKHTPLRTTFGVIMLALVDGSPRLLPLKQALKIYLEHRQEVVRRRSEHDLARLRKRAHILEGLLIALGNLDEVIQIIRKSRTAETAHKNLRKRFGFTNEQAQAILDMPLRRLAALERKKLEAEYKETKKQIKALEALLRSPKKMRAAIAEELLAVKAQFADPRRTRIVRLDASQKGKALTVDALLPDQTVWVALDATGNIARLPEGKAPRLSGRHAPIAAVRASTREALYLVAADGQAAAVPIHTLPEAAAPADGAPWHSLVPALRESPPVALFAAPANPEKGFVLTVTRQGMVKKSELATLPAAGAQAFTLVKINPGDSLLTVLLTSGKDEILLFTAGGMGIRFSEEEVRPMGLVAAGVAGIKLKGKDKVVGAVKVLQGKGMAVLMVADNASARRVAFEEFPQQKRYGQGVQAWKLPQGARLVGVAAGKPSAKVGLHFRKAAAKAVRLDAAPLRKRSAARGAKIATLKPKDEVVKVVG
ncbi:MAG TPA: DNA topoisomerase (ATP-hydrolyzing) subunit A [Chloroflexi bacterium]|nr:DNA topoisomerase (ATP-hydrolyzing) subunit A [Chloroflexota bacterium]